MLRGMNDWRDILPELLCERDLSTQAAIVHALEEASGVTLNQATISRELTALGAVKLDGAYRLPPAPEVGAPIHSFVVTAGGCLVVVKSDPAYASVVGQAIDAARLPGVLGTIAGDDTVFVALRDEAHVAPLRRALGLRGDETRRTAA